MSIWESSTNELEQQLFGNTITDRDQVFENDLTVHDWRPTATTMMDGYALVQKMTGGKVGIGEMFGKWVPKFDKK